MLTSPSCAEPTGRTRVCILSPSLVHREGLARLLGERAGIEVCSVVGELHQALGSVRSELPDVVLVDASSREARTATCLLAEMGALVFVAGVEDDDEEIRCWWRLGMRGYATLASSLDDLAEALHETVAGRFRPLAARACVAPVPEGGRMFAARLPSAILTTREWMILQLLERGRSNKEIAVQLFIEIATVKSHVHSLLRKLGVSSRNEAAARARDLGRFPGTLATSACAPEI